MRVADPEGRAERTKAGLVVPVGLGLECPPSWDGWQDLTVVFLYLRVPPFSLGLHCVPEAIADSHCSAQQSEL